MRKVDIPLLFAAIALLVVILAIVLADYPQYADCTHQKTNSDGLCHFPWWYYSGAWIAIFTIVLTGSTAALWWATKDAVRDARRIGEAQVRAYVSIKSVKFIFMGQTDPLPGVQMIAVNTGQSPAVDFEWLPTLEYQTKAGMIVEPFSEELFLGVGIEIGASRRHKAMHVGTLNFVSTISRHMEMPEAVMIRVQIHYRWKDVFGEEFYKHQTFMGMAEKQPSDQNMREIHPLNDSQWACKLEPVSGDGENMILVKAKDDQRDP